MKQLLALLTLIPYLALAQNPNVNVWKSVADSYSPDSTIFASAYLTHKKTLAIDIYVDGKPFMNIDSIGLVTDAGNCYTFRNVEEESEGIVAYWESSPLWGKQKNAIKHIPPISRVLYPKIHNKEGAFCFFLYVTNDGVAYAFSTYKLPIKRIYRETTHYNFPCDGIAWSIPANFESYEFLYREQPLSKTSDANTPFTFHLDNGLWGSIHEAGIDKFPEMTLVQENPLSFRSWLCPSADKDNGFSIPLSDDVWHHSPIRTVTIARSATGLANSNLIPSVVGGTINTHFPLDHIHPLKYIGIWWGMHLGINDWTPGPRHGATTENAIRYIDFAANNNIDAVLLEGWNKGWETWGKGQHFSYTEAAEDMDIDSVCRYAKSNGVEIIIHHETGGNWREYESQIDSIFRWCIAHDIYAIKTGYAGGFPDQELHHSVVGVNHYNTVMRKAAEYGIMLDVHEPIKPSGWEFPYPNLMTGEGVRGQEWNAWSDGNPPSHTCTLPFTRGLAGPTDYTPGIFDINYDRIKGDTNVRKWNMKDARECSVHTTLCHQMALWVVLYSPWQMAADLIENYEEHPCFQFFRDFDPDCEWSRMLDGYPGQYVVTVRKAKNQYFIGAITNEESRQVFIPLDFLPQGATFRCQIYMDGKADYLTAPTEYEIRETTVTNKSTLDIPLGRGGGCAIRIDPR